MHRKILFFTILIPLSISFFSCGSSRNDAGKGDVPQGPWVETKAGMEARHGISIEFDDIRFPSHWASFNPNFQVLPESRRYYALQKLEIDLGRYSPRFLKEYLHTVFIPSGLTIDGQPYGGTNESSSRWLYLLLSWLGDNGHSEAMGFHHEFSSILYKKNRSVFPTAAWRAANPDGFAYAHETSTSSNIASGRTGTTGNASTYRIGFLCEYGQLTLEDDINTYAQYLVAKPDMLNQIGADHEIVRKKTALLHEFMDAIGYYR